MAISSTERGHGLIFSVFGVIQELQLNPGCLGFITP